MEMNGITLDVNALGEIGGELDLHLDQLVKSIYQQAGKTFNIGSPKQLGEVLFNDLNLADKAKKTKTGQYKTDEQTLQTLEGKHPIIADILSWRESSKLKSTYLDALPQHCVKQTGRIHTHFHQLVAATGRLASSDPNLQNIPVRSEAGKKVRKAFICSRAKTAGGGYELLSCDYSQIELRVMAAIANDTAMIEAFQNHEDIHRATAAKVFGVASDEVTGDMRRTAKMVNFGIIYGISAFGLSQRLGIPRAEAAEVIEAYFREYPAIRLFMENTVRQARDQGYVETLGGRRRSFPDLDSANQNLRSNAERSAINTPIQGTAADMIKLAMVQIDQVIREGCFQSRMLLQVHDELVFDLAEHEKEMLVPKILGCMKHALELPNGVPIEVEYGIGPNWLVAH
jgi:DNA polymerase-1